MKQLYKLVVAILFKEVLCPKRIKYPLGGIDTYCFLLLFWK